MRRSAAALIVALAWIFACVAAAAAPPGEITMSATINGQDVGGATTRDPVRLEPSRSPDITVTFTNHTGNAVNVRRIELVGRVIGLAFYKYSTTVALAVAPGATETLRYQLDLVGLKGEATGLIRGTLSATDADGNQIAAIPTVTDVRGSLLSVYGLFGIALAVITGLALLELAFAVAKHHMSKNRWKRGLRMLAPGVGIGLVVAFTASVLRLWVPDTSRWMVLAGVTAAVFFAVGYFSPTPHSDEDDDDLDEEARLDALLDAGTSQLPTQEPGR